MTTLSVGRTLEDGRERLSDDANTLFPLSLALYAAFLVVQVGTQSQLEIQSDELVEAFPRFADIVPDELPLALDVPLGVAWLIWLAGCILLVTASMVTFRALVDERRLEDVDESASSPVGGESAETHSLVELTIYGVGAAFVGTIVVGIGLFAFVIPGLVVATVFAFTHPYIATERVGVFEAMARSLELTRGNRLRVFVVLVVIVLSFQAITFVGSLVALVFESLPLLAELVHAGFTALAWLVVLAILASAFERLERVRAERERKWEGIDDELLP